MGYVIKSIDAITTSTQYSIINGIWAYLQDMHRPFSIKIQMQIQDAFAIPAYKYHIVSSLKAQVNEPLWLRWGEKKEKERRKKKCGENNCVIKRRNMRE